MPPPEPDLDRLTSLLSMCLGRIEEHAFRLQDGGGTDHQDLVGCAIEDETALLQDLVGSLLEGTRPEHANLNATVERAVLSCLDELGIPVVVRQRLAPDLPAVDCAPGPLAFAVQRALMLGIGRLEPGGEVVLTTRQDHGGVLFELESYGIREDRHLQERAETLAEFVAGLRGSCRVQTGGSDRLLLAIELPAVFAVDER